MPPEHVITKSFYLMQEYPGRYAGATLWVEGGETQTLDGVAAVIVGSNDWAGAWAVDELGAARSMRWCPVARGNGNWPTVSGSIW